MSIIQLDISLHINLITTLNMMTLIPLFLILRSLRRRGYSGQSRCLRIFG